MQCLAIWNKCNNKCLMCSNPSDYGQWGDYGFDTLTTRIKKFSPKEEEIYLTGGEPTLRPNFFELLTAIRKRCPQARIIIDTNGRLFAYRDFLKKCLNYGNLEFQISLCGHNASLHDKITGVGGSFEQTIQGIKNLLLAGLGRNEIEIRAVIHKLTLPHLKEIYNFAQRKLKGIKRLVFIFMEMEGVAGENFKKAGITYEEARLDLAALLKKIINSKPCFEVRFYHFPLCVLSIEFWPYLWRTLPEKEIAFLPSCSKCFYKKYCLGIHKDYLKHVGGKEFQPIREKIKIEIINNFYHPIVNAIN